MSDEPKPVVERVTFVDVTGKHCDARRIGPVAADGKALLLIGSGLASLSVRRVRQSAHPQPGTWYRRALPS